MKILSKLGRGYLMVLGILTILAGIVLISTTVSDNTALTLGYKAVGLILVALGAFIGFNDKMKKNRK
ncbi:hypothetical protein ACFO0S_08330 [Chryseomicrobium palamuruense]|uniref:DUF3188 domain-containing protein n=1 Tax=Chryseomicrobium palamuruense TaxID=682973 RepID=A0ABV8UVS1_9BACL